MRLVGRLFLLVLGLGVAIPFGALALMIGIVLEPTARELVGTLGFATVQSIFTDLSSGYPPDERAVALITALGTGLFTLLVAPPTFVALVGEVIGVRSLLWYGGGAGIVTALLPWLGRARVGRFADAALQAEGRITALLFLTGATTGLVYWAIAGRSAGRRRVAFAPAPSAGRA